MEYTVLGKTKRKVSRLGFGGATAGLKNYLEPFDPASPESFRDVLAAIDMALTLGITYFDTAPGYGDGASERMFGAALDGVDPDDIFLATKVGFGDRDHVLHSLEQSLRNLRRDTIDLLQIHGASFSQDLETAIFAPDGMVTGLIEAKETGLVKHIGFTTEDNNEAVYHLIRCGTFDTIQLCYNLLYQHPFDPVRPFGSMIAADEQELGIITMRTTTSGTFQRWIKMVNPDNTFDYARALIQFVLSNPLVDVALVGMRTAALVRENVAVCDDLAGRIDLEHLHDRYV